VSGTENAGGMILHNIILPVAIVIAIAGLMTEESWLKRFFSSRLLVLLGNASFAFYLIHISYVNLRISKLIIMPDRNFTLLWVISILIYLLIEKPVYDRLRSLIDKK
jgi:peptidoglycan/LPS O-acetylase OafA/YrhL